MEAKDKELISQHRKSNYDLDRLMKEHDALEAEVESMEKTKGLSDDDEIRLHRLKKDKLEGRDQIEAILQTLR
ncbi:MAG: YdcH family protein [bacterium]|nr:YdcH family protein [bacterium]